MLMLINLEDGSQELIQGVDYCDRSKIVWKGEEFPSNLLNKVGGIVNTNGNLSVDETKLATSNTVKQQKLQAKNQKKTNEESKAYLASTDWYVIRKSETNVAIPADVVTARAAARLAIVEE
jgi:hypothetical protein